MVECEPCPPADEDPYPRPTTCRGPYRSDRVSTHLHPRPPVPFGGSSLCVRGRPPLHGGSRHPSDPRGVADTDGVKVSGDGDEGGEFITTGDLRVKGVHKSP